MDAEFYGILSVYNWHKCGLKPVNIDDIPYSWALGVKYLIEYNQTLERLNKIG